MRPIRPNHPYLREYSTEVGRPLELGTQTVSETHQISRTSQIFQGKKDWPLYSVTVHNTNGEDFGTPGFSLGMSTKRSPKATWVPMEIWSPFPLEMGPILIEMLKKVLCPTT